MDDYTLEQIEVYINELEKRYARLIRLQDKLLNIPLIGWHLYSKSIYIQGEITILKEDLVNAKSGNVRAKDNLIKKISPIIAKNRIK